MTEVALEPEPAEGAALPEDLEAEERIEAASEMLAATSAVTIVEVGRITSSSDKVVETLKAAAGSQHLLVMGAAKAFGEVSLSFGPA